MHLVPNIFMSYCVTWTPYHINDTTLPGVHLVMNILSPILCLSQVYPTNKTPILWYISEAFLYILLALCISENIRGRIQYFEGKENTRKKLGDTWEGLDWGQYRKDREGILDCPDRRSLSFRCLIINYMWPPIPEDLHNSRILHRSTLNFSLQVATTTRWGENSSGLPEPSWSLLKIIYLIIKS